MSDDRTFPVDEGPCAICGERPAEVLGLVCPVCKLAIDADEPWTHAHPEVLERLRALEEDDDRPPA